jgi:hypothetical protein
MPGNKNDPYNGQHVPIATMLSPSYGTEQVVLDEAVPSQQSEAAPLIGQVSWGVDQPPSPKCQDVPFAVLFLAHLGVMIWLGVFVAPQGFQKIDINMTAIEDEIRQGDDVTEEDLQQMEEFAAQVAKYVQVYPARILLYLVVPCLLLAFLVAFVFTAVVIKPCPKPLVYSCLVGSILFTALVMLSSAIASGAIPMYFVTALALGAVFYYVRLAWRMVPFAAVNLKVALEGISRNCGVYIVAFLFAELGFFWVIYWFYVVVGVSAYENAECLAEHPEATWDDDTCSPPAGIFLLLLLSLYWTNTVFMNTIQVTVAG